MGEDPVLLERLRKGDVDAFERQVQSIAPKVFNLVLRMARRPQEAEDLTQEIMLQAWRHLSSFRGDCSFYTWVYRIAVTRILNHLRKKVPRWDSLDDPGEDDRGQVRQREVPDSSMAPERALMAGEMQNALDQAIGQLAEGNRMVFVMREVQGMEFEAIAEVLQCRQDAVRARLSRARKQLQDILRPYLERS